MRHNLGEFLQYVIICNSIFSWYIQGGPDKYLHPFPVERDQYIILNCANKAAF